MAIPINHPFGEIAIELDFITREQLEEALRRQKALLEMGARARIGRRLVLMEAMDEEQIKEVLALQRKRRFADTSKKLPMERFGDYKLLELVAEGELGAIYKARDLLKDRGCALKVLKPRLGHVKKGDTLRFQREVFAARDLDHPNIVTTYNQGSLKGVQFIAMELLEGESLKDRIERMEKVPEAVMLGIAIGVAKGLGHAHSKGLVHRDVKPENIFLGNDGSTKLTDFGLTKSMLGDSRLTQTGQIIGTPFYISPEQAQGEHQIGPGSDLYSLGGTLYHALTGRMPFDAPSRVKVLLLHVKGTLTNPKDLNPGLSDGFVQVVVKLMAKKPEDRYTSAAQLVEDLECVKKGEPPINASLAEGRSSVLSPDPERAKAMREQWARMREAKRVGGSAKVPSVPSQGERKGKGCFTAIAFSVLAALSFFLAHGV